MFYFSPFDYSIDVDTFWSRADLMLFAGSSIVDGGNASGMLRAAMDGDRLKSPCFEPALMVDMDGELNSRWILELFDMACPSMPSCVS